VLFRSVQRVTALTDHFNDVTRLIETATDSASRFVDDDDPSRQMVIRDHARSLPDVVLMELLRRMGVRAGVGADHLGTRTLEPVVRMIHDGQGGRRVVELKNGVRVVITGPQVIVSNGSQGD